MTRAGLLRKQLAGIPLLLLAFVERITRMTSVGLLRFRMIVAMLLGVFFVLESANSGFLPAWALSRTNLAHALVGLFGIVWLGQAVYLKRELDTRTLK